MSVDSRNFLAKDNITSLYKTIINNNELENIQKQDKELLINQLIRNMKIKFKTLDNSKINQKNINSIKKQFNNLCIKESQNMINNLVNKYKKTNIIHDRKYERDFNTFDNRGKDCNIFQRPIPTNSSDITPTFNNNVNNANNANNNFQTNMNPRSTSMSLGDRLKQMEEERRETRPVPQVPEFLKQVSVGKKDEFQNQQQPPQNTNYLQKMESDFGDFQPFGQQNTESFSNLEGMNFDNNKYTENISLSDRLSQLEKERNNIKLPQDNNPPNQPINPPTNFPPVNNNPPNQPINPPTNFPPVNNNPPNQPINPPTNFPPVNNNPPNPPVNTPTNFSQNNQPFFNNENHQSKIDDLYNIIEKLRNEITILKSDKGKQQVEYISRPSVRNLQLDINKTDSEYIYKFNQVNNIIAIKLIAYSLPQARFNFNECKLNYIINDKESTIEKEILIPLGYYNTSTLLEILNNNEDIKFSLGYNQKIEINSKQEEQTSDDASTKEFKLVNNATSQRLGFLNTEDNFVSQLMADKLIDLRVPSKINMYILNLQDNLPFGVLNFNGSSTCELTFNKPISLDNLHVLFLSENREKYDFNELEYNLSFHISVLEDMNQSANLY